MSSILCAVSSLLATTFLFLISVLPAYGQAAPAKWESTRSDNGTRYLTYTATATLLGKTVPVSVGFFCDPAPSKNDVHGAIGFDFYVGAVAKLKPFDFDAFEGPDARTGKLMLVTINRKGKPAQSYKLAPSGATPSEGNFIFGIADESRVATSDSKTILKALADNGESMQISITDPRNAKLKLEINVPVADRQTDFKALLVGLK